MKFGTQQRGKKRITSSPPCDEEQSRNLERKHGSQLAGSWSDLSSLFVCVCLCVVSEEGLDIDFAIAYTPYSVHTVLCTHTHPSITTLHNASYR
jgi:hypothetical protein